MPPSDIEGRTILRAIAYMVAGMLVLPFLNASVKHLTLDYPTVQIAWARYAGHFVYMLVVFLPAYGPGLLRTENLSVQLVRSSLLLASTLLYFYALNFLPLPTAAAIGFTAPFIVTALSAPMLGESIGWRRWTAVAVGFLGALLIIRPGGAGLANLAGLLILGSASCFALYQILTRRIANSDSPETSVTYTAIVGALAVSLVLPFHWKTPDGWLDVALFLGLGLFGGVGHFLVVKAFQHGPASVISPFTYTQLIGATALGFFVFGDFPDALTWLGAAVIVGSGLFITYRESRRRAPRQAG